MLEGKEFSGRGTYTFPNGDKYDGEWKNGKMHGKGTYTWADGVQYEGRWEGGKMIKVNKTHSA